MRRSRRMGTPCTWESNERTPAGQTSARIHPQARANAWVGHEQTPQERTGAHTQTRKRINAIFDSWQG
eukprot:14517819-Alexandrium_andersonii.AAC.1